MNMRMNVEHTFSDVNLSNPSIPQLENQNQLDQFKKIPQSSRGAVNNPLCHHTHISSKTAEEISTELRVRRSFQMFYFNFRKPKSFLSFQNTFQEFQHSSQVYWVKRHKFVSQHPHNQNADIAEGKAVETIQKYYKPNALKNTITLIQPLILLSTLCSFQTFPLPFAENCIFTGRKLRSVRSHEISKH